MAHSEDNNESVETDPEPTQKWWIRTLKQSKKLYSICSHVKETSGRYKKIQIKLLEMKITKSEMKNVLELMAD